jgi:hypothetical protein
VGAEAKFFAHLQLLAFSASSSLDPSSLFCGFCGIGATLIYAHFSIGFMPIRAISARRPDA